MLAMTESGLLQPVPRWPVPHIQNLLLGKAVGLGDNPASRAEKGVDNLGKGPILVSLKKIYPV